MIRRSRSRGGPSSWGGTLIDTAHLYGGGANEELLASALYPYPDELVITTKVGVARTGSGAELGAHRRSGGARLAAGALAGDPADSGRTRRRTSPRPGFS
ncbi:aldo/keto reductase [Amycolatopsis sp. NPDC051106]|uniref:aldo/keto reductase n=1 Tax=unclassified Amycolatopsis TaxID=2618356 RepID=UPI003427E148